MSASSEVVIRADKAVHAPKGCVAQRRAFAAPKRLRPRRRERGIFSVHPCFDRV
jgi:hypothetical protein